MANEQNILNVRILHAYKPAASWDKTTVLKQGEVGFESDTGKWKVGDGATTWEKLAYMVDKYALPLSGGTLSGTVFFGTTNYYIDAQANANLKSLNVDEYVKVGNGSKFYANNSGEGYFSHNLGIGVEPDDDYSLKVADNSYFYGDILLADKKQIRRNGNEVTWIGGRDGAMIRQMSYSGYSPVFSAKTTNGDWSFGPYSNNILYLTYCTDLKYNEGKNEPTTQFIFYPSGNFVSSYIGINGSNTGYRFYVNGSSFLNGDIIHNGTIYLANGKTYYINNNAQAYFNRIGIGTPPSSDYLLIVNGISHLKGDTRISGNLYMTNSNSQICWDSDSYRQRILTTDDATSDTEVFTFQQSSDKGSSWSTLFTIKDNGKIVVPNDIIANKSIRNLEIGGGIYWNPYIESGTDASDVASITVIKNGCAGGTELRISQQNDATDVINLTTNSYIYLNGKRAFQINDSWLRINQDIGFSSGIYTGQSMVRTDNQFQIGDNGNKFYVNSSGNGYINNTLGIGGIDTTYKLYVNGISYLKGNTTYGGHIYADTNYAYDIGQSTKEFKNLYTRAIAARHIDADAVFTGDHFLYIGYGSAAYTTEIKMYYSSSLENRIEYFRINSNGAYALTRFGVNGQNTSYTFYVNGTNYLNGDTTINGNLYFTNSSKQIRWTCGDNDYGRIFCSHTGSNAGYMEIATADDATEPIYIRQYSGVFSALNTTLTLLDGSHNTIIPNALTVGTGTSQGANYKFYVNGLSYFNGDISRVGNIYPLENNTKILGSSSLKWANIYATTFTGNLNGSADRLDDWHLNEVKRSGFITSGTSGLSSYWFPIWNGTFTNKQYDDYTLDLWITSGFNDRRGIISLKIRQNGNNNSGAYNFGVTLRITNGNLDKNSFKLFYNNSTGNVQLWANVGGQYGVLNYTVLSETWRTSNNLNKVGTLTAQNFASVQTQPSSGYSSITASWQNTFSSDADTVDGYHHDAFVKRAGDTMTGSLTINATLFAGSKLRLWSDGEGGNIRFITPGNANNIYEFDNCGNVLRLYYCTDGGTGAKGFQSWTWGTDGSFIAKQFNGYLNGNAATATKLQTARTLTIGNTGKNFDGTANVSWSRDEIGCSYGHYTSWDFKKAYSSQYVTFDVNSPSGGPGGWINAFVSTHNNYLSSFIVNVHRSGDWYVGWSEHADNNVNPTWYKLLHTGNYAGILDSRYVNVSGDIMTGNLTVPSVYTSNWFRSTGATGWYSETFGGGWYMTDSTYIRNYNGKTVRMDNVCLGADNNSYRLYVNGDAYFSGTNHVYGTTWVSGTLNIGNTGYGDYPLAVTVKSLFQEDMTCAKVTIRSGLYLTSWTSSTYGGKINFGDGDYVHLYEIADDKLEIKSNYTWLTSNVAIGLGSGSTTTYNEHKLYVNGSGYFSSIGIFGTNTSYRLFVNGSSYFNSSIYTGSTIYFGGGTTYYVNASATSYLFHLSIGGVNTSYKLYVNGSSYFNGALTFYGSDSFGIFTTRTNYGSIGSSSYKWYRSYINNMYGTVSSSGSDYAEYFEWADSNTNNEDRVGLFVTFDEKYPKKIRIANEKDTYILGIVSGKPSIIGNSDEDSYKYQYETDDFGRYIYEDKEHKKIKERETYDKTKKYIPRSERQEWDTIGMLGVLPIKDNGLCEVGGYCKCGDNGIAIPSDFGYRIVERISKNVIKVVFK